MGVLQIGKLFRRSLRPRWPRFRERRISLGLKLGRPAIQEALNTPGRRPFERAQDMLWRR